MTKNAASDSWDDTTKADTHPAPPPSEPYETQSMAPVAKIPESAPDWAVVVVSNFDTYRQELKDYARELQELARDLKAEQKRHEKIDIAIRAQVEAGIDRVLAKMGATADVDAQDRQFLKEQIIGAREDVTAVSTQLEVIKTETTTKLESLRRTVEVQAGQIGDMANRLRHLEEDQAIVNLREEVRTMGEALEKLSQRIAALEGKRPVN